MERKPPTAYGGFANHGREFDSGTYENPNDNACVLKSSNKTDGVIVLSNQKSYLYYPAIKKKLLVINKLPGETPIEPLKIDK